MAYTGRWIFPLVWQGYQRRLEPEDVYDVLPKCSSQYLFTKFDRCWSAGDNESLLVCLTKLHRTAIFKYFCGAALQEITRTLQPVLVVILVAYLQDKDQVSPYVAYACAVGSVIGGLVGGIANNWQYMGWHTIAMQLTSMMTAAIYRKVLRLSNFALAKMQSGHIVTLVASDVEMFHQALRSMGFTLVAVIEIPLILGLMSKDYGLSTIGGVILMAIIILVFIFMAKLSKSIRLQVLKCTDSRVLVMSEILAAMRVIKMYCWEKTFAQVIMKHRKNEIKNVFKMNITRSLNGALSQNVSKLGIMTMVLYQVWSGGTLELGALVRLIAWWEILKRTGGLYVAFTLSSLSEMTASTKRIQDFLSSEEKEPFGKPCHIPKDIHANTEIKSAVCFNGFSGRWSDTFSVENISFTIPKGSLVAIVGPVGAGKTSLLMAILKELPASEGTVSICGNLGYVPQEAWIFSDTVRANILFGEALEYDKYMDTTQACCLQPDISGMPLGDQTPVGERGLMLSGGQKARINLARAIYRDADIFLLDDPLSAVDAKVGRQIYERCILTKLRGKTRVLVTHQLQYLDNVDHIYVVKDGKLIANGSYKELSEQVDLHSILSLNTNSVRMDDDFSEVPNKDHTAEVVSSQNVNAVKEEERERGRVALTPVIHLLKAGHGVILFPLVLLFFIIYRVAFFGSDAWSMYWVNDYKNISQSRNATLALDVDAKHIHDWLGQRTCVYVGLVVVGGISVLLGVCLYAVLMALASKNLHDAMFNKVLLAPLIFFDTNPIGRILNRFSRDTGLVDNLLTFILMYVTEHAVLFLGVCIMVCVANPWSLIPTVPLFAIIVIFRNFAINTVRELKRIEGINRSPVFSHLSSSFQGLQAIRAFGMEPQMINIFQQFQDMHTASWYLFTIVFRWFGLYLDVILVFYYGIIVLVMFLFPVVGLRTSLVGISLTYVTGTMGTFQFIIRMTAELESLMTSVERIQQYSCLDQEASKNTNVLPPSSWPQKGQIRFEHMSLAFSEHTPDALKDINLTIEGQQKIGIVGRTGAGKSSLFAAILRLYEPKGHIWIDNIDVMQLGLTHLRQAIAVIPQDPVLFSGTFRYNLDPFSEYADEQIWSALNEVQLKYKVQDLPGGLESPVSEAGSNLSVGERQLVCLARAILRQSRIIIIDEATANVDTRTDELIQRAIREKFTKRTVLCIAHRLDTIIDSDKVMVLDEGRVVQFDHPHVLLQETAGAFHQMALHVGVDHMLHLKMKAEEAFDGQMTRAGENANCANTKPDSKLPETGYYNAGMSDADISEMTRL